MDITDTLVPKSDQLNAEDMLAGPRIVTVEKVTKGSDEQPVNIHLVEFPGRPFKPSKTVRRILVAAWGAEAANYTGRRMMLYRDASVRFGGQDVGGIRVSALSHIESRITISLTVTRGRRAPFTVDPLPALPDGPPAITEEAAAGFQLAITEAETLEKLESIAADLKTWDLGNQRKSLLSMWSDRKKAIEAAS